METEEEDEDSEEEYSGDDDMSWKVSKRFHHRKRKKREKKNYFIFSPQVRRCAAKCLEAIISTRPDLLIDFYSTISPVLIVRFKGS
jgi:cullin-associated NEDD8-dissociated protein 1